MYYSSVVVVHPAAGPGVVLANNPRSRSPPPKRKPLTMKAASSETHHVLHPAGFGSAAFSGSRPKFQPNYPQYLLQQGRGGLSKAKVGATSEAAAGSCCFGEVVGDDMLKEFGTKEASSEDRARLALRLMNDADKKGQASRYVANLKDMYGYGCSTLCLVYNATGEPLHYHKDHDWAGSLLPGHRYPEEIGNGQWAAFLHVHDHNQGAAAIGSAGAVVYRANFNGKGDRDFLLAWDTPTSLMKPKKAYCHVGAADSHEPDWKSIQAELKKASYITCRHDVNPLEVEAQTEGVSVNSPTFTAILKNEPSAA